jgi:hypothetical protein
MGYGLYVLSPARLGLFVTAFAKTLARAERRDTYHWGVRTTRLHRPLSATFVSRDIRAHRNTRDDRDAPLNRVRRTNSYTEFNF